MERPSAPSTPNPAHGLISKTSMMVTPGVAGCDDDEYGRTTAE
jgi:hypothetical protein